MAGRIKFSDLLDRDHRPVTSLFQAFSVLAEMHGTELKTFNGAVVLQPASDWFPCLACAGNVVSVERELQARLAPDVAERICSLAAMGLVLLWHPWLRTRNGAAFDCLGTAA